MKVKKKLIIGGVILCAAIGFLIYTLVDDSLNYYVTVGDLLAHESDRYDEKIRVAGTVTDGSVVWDSEAGVLHFTIADDTASLPIIYEGSMPDNLTTGKNIVVEGKYRPDRLFHADKIIQKCPSKYVPKN